MPITCTYIYIYFFFFVRWVTVIFLKCSLRTRAPLEIAVDNFARQISIIFAIGRWQIGDRAARARSNDDDSRGTINGSPCGWYSCVYTRARIALENIWSRNTNRRYKLVTYFVTYECAYRGGRKILPARLAYGSFPRRLISDNVDVPFSQSPSVLTLIRQIWNAILFRLSFYSSAVP